MLGQILMKNKKLFPKILPVVHHHLKIPMSVEHSSHVHNQATHPLPFAALSLFLPGLSSPSSPAPLDDPIILHSVKDHWDAIWYWCHSFLCGYMEHRENTPREMDEQRKLHVIPTAVLVGLSNHSDMTETLASTPDFIPFMARVWKFEIGRSTSGQIVSASVVLTQVFSRERSSCNSFDLFIACLGGIASATEIATSCVQRVYDTSDHPVIGCSALRADLAMISCCCQEKSRWRAKLYRAFMAVNAVSSVTYSMSRLTSRNAKFEDHPLAQDCLKLCTTFLWQCFAEDGVHLIALALQGRMLLSMFKADRITWDEKNKTPGPATSGGAHSLHSDYECLLQFLTPYLIYRSVLRQAVKSIKTIHTLDLERKMEVIIPKTEFFWDLWTRFKIYTENRVACKESTVDYLRGLEEKYRVCESPSVCLLPTRIFSRYL